MLIFPCLARWCFNIQQSFRQELSGLFFIPRRVSKVATTTFLFLMYANKFQILIVSKVFE